MKLKNDENRAELKIREEVKLKDVEQMKGVLFKRQVRWGQILCIDEGNRGTCHTKKCCNGKRQNEV